MIYAVNKLTKEHRILSDCPEGWTYFEVDGLPCIEPTGGCGSCGPFSGKKAAYAFAWAKTLSDKFDIVPADADDWIECDGMTCPTNSSQYIQWKAGKFHSVTIPADCVFWGEGGAQKITAYRPILDAHAEDKPWNGEGLPPVGTVCEWKSPSQNWKCGYIIATFEDRVWLTTGDGLKEQVWNLSVVEFRPIRTDRERWIEAVMNQCNAPYISPKELAGAIYDAGLARMPEDEL